MCARVCPVKSIKVENHQAKIMAPTIVFFAGSVYWSVPQGAKVVPSELEKVKSLLNGEDPVILSLAPSYYGAFDVSDTKKFVGWLKALGFFGVAETSAAAAYVTAEYYELMKKNEQKNIITTSCPSANRLIETYIHP